MFLHKFDLMRFAMLPLLAIVVCGCQTKDDPAPTTSTESTKTAPAAPEPVIEHVKYVAPGLTAKEIQSGWISLFDGVSLYGWHPNSSANWSVVDGEIRASEGDRGLLLTGFQISDFEFRCDFQLSEGGNSGVFLRSPQKPKNPAEDCYELNICDTHQAFKTGSLVGRAKPGTDVATDGKWNTFHVRVVGSMVNVTLNGEEVLEYTAPANSKLRTGFIGLQKNSGRIAFKNIYLKPVGELPLFNGESLAGWREVPGGSGKFDVDDKTIHVTGGPGFLETEQKYGDFILQAEVKVNAQDKPLNSGIFFRAIAGTEKAPSNGYEFQIQNGFKDGDRHDPEDHGTGAIFRRIKARYVPGDDNTWMNLTLMAQGPAISTWVNGYQVVEWTDTRARHDNPRRGLRLDAGHISLQAHDPTTDLNFRNLRLVPVTSLQ